MKTSFDLHLHNNHNQHNMSDVSFKLSLFQTSPISLPFLDSDSSLPNSLLLIGGLTDIQGSIPYSHKLAAQLHSTNYSLILPTLTSSLSGYGTSSLQGDSQEISSLLNHLRNKCGKSNLILMGHSTGCQDLMTYLSQTGKDLIVKGAILQAPVSDRDDFNARKTEKDEGLLRLAEQLIKDGKGYELLPRDEKTFQTSVTVNNGNSGDLKGNSDIVLNPPTTAYRYHSLYAKDGDDDFFSDDLSDEELKSRFQVPISNCPILALLGENDEYVPEPLSSKDFQSRWSNLFSGSKNFKAHLLKGANHKVVNEESQSELCKQVLEFINEVEK